MTQEIIVYRNPGEKMLWALLLNDPKSLFMGVFTIVLSLLISMGFYHGVSWVWNRVRNKFRFYSRTTTEWADNLIMIASVVVFVLSFITLINGVI